MQALRIRPGRAGRTYDPRAIRDVIYEHYASKWGAHPGPETDALALELMLEESSYKVGRNELAQVPYRRHPYQLDAEGLTAWAYVRWHGSHAECVENFVTDYLRDLRTGLSPTLPVKPFGKVSPYPDLANIRVIIPMPATLGMCDSVLARALDKEIDRFLRRVCLFTRVP